MATGIYPYWTNAEGALVTCDPKIVDAPGTYDFTRVVPVDFSNDFEAQPTSEQLQARAEKYVEANKIGIPKTSITASFVQLEQFPEYEDLALLEKCDLCDTVTIRYPQLGVEAKAEIVKIETDVLLERYNSVEIGDVRTNIADTIVGQQQEIKQKPSETYLREAVLALTETILGASGGAVRLLDTNNDACRTRCTLRMIRTRPRRAMCGALTMRAGVRAIADIMGRFPTEPRLKTVWLPILSQRAHSTLISSTSST